jgi:drug/metabolite transporter (DMT)-like permease
MAFAVGGAIGLVWIAAGRRWRDLWQPPAVWVLGIGGLFGYHGFYFTALQNAPPVEASLITSLWPLLLVLLSALLPGERLRWYHLAGALLGFSGAALIVTRGSGVTVDPAYLPGYAAALACAFIWSGYSVLSRRLVSVPTGAVAGFCLATAVLSGAAHFAFEHTVAPTAAGWVAILLLGLLPVGVAFYVWDYGVKHGDIRAVGAGAYLTPLLSTAILVATGTAPGSWSIAAAALLVTAGAGLASRDLFRRRPPLSP